MAKKISDQLNEILRHWKAARKDKTDNPRLLPEHARIINEAAMKLLAQIQKEGVAAQFGHEVACMKQLNTKELVLVLIKRFVSIWDIVPATKPAVKPAPKPAVKPAKK